MKETEKIAKEIGGASAVSAEAYEAMGKAVDFRAESREHEAGAEAKEVGEEGANNEATAKKAVCECWVVKKARIAKLRKAGKVAAVEEAGTWALKGCEAEERANAKRLSVRKRKAKVQLTSGEVGALWRRGH